MNRRTALAHARLSVIDPGHRSDQPMSDEREELRIVFNGEITTTTTCAMNYWAKATRSTPPPIRQ